MGSTTLSAAAIATAASNALPPAARIESPASVASGCPVLTIPVCPTAGAEGEACAQMQFAGTPSPNASPASDRIPRILIIGLVIEISLHTHRDHDRDEKDQEKVGSFLPYARSRTGERGAQASWRQR